MHRTAATMVILIGDDDEVGCLVEPVRSKTHVAASSRQMRSRVDAEREERDPDDRAPWGARRGLFVSAAKLGLPTRYKWRCCGQVTSTNKQGRC